MRVLLGAFGTRGDVQPFLGLSRALREAGHEVVLAVPPSSKLLAESFGEAPRAVGLDFEALSAQVATGSAREVFAALPLLRGQLEVQFDALQHEASRCDVIVGGSVFAVGSLLSDLLHRPYVFVALCPQLLPSRAHPTPSVPWQTLPGWLNRLTWWLNDVTWSLVLGAPVRRRRSALGLAPVHGVWDTFLGRRVLVGSDPALAPVPADASWRVLAQTGAFFAEDPRPLSAEVEAFLARGPAPVFIGFGSMSDPRPAETAKRLMASARQAGVRALISRGWARLEAPVDGDDVCFIDNEPHARLFPRCAAVVHHGGAGTTHAAARAGVPQVLMPQLLDQHYWAHRIPQVGVGPRAVPRHARDPRLLAAALKRCVDDDALRHGARELSRRLVTDGLQRAVKAIEVVVHEPVAPRVLGG